VKYVLYSGAPVVRNSSAAAHSRSSAQLPSPYSPVCTPQQFRNTTPGLRDSQRQARSAAARAVAANSGSNGWKTRAAMAMTAAKSPVAHELLKGADPVPIT
jgi:hypothetical protein